MMDNEQTCNPAVTEGRCKQTKGQTKQKEEEEAKSTDCLRDCTLHGSE